MFRSSFFLSLSILIGVIIVLVFYNSHDRYILAPYQQGVFVFDRKYKRLNYCTDKACQIISSSTILSNSETFPLPSQSSITQAFVPLKGGSVTGIPLSAQTAVCAPSGQAAPKQAGTVAAPAESSGGEDAAGGEAAAEEGGNTAEGGGASAEEEGPAADGGEAEGGEETPADGEEENA